MRTRIIITFIAIAILTGTSCRKGYEDLNKNPNGFTTASTGSLFNSVIKSLMLGWNEMFYINNEILYKQTQLGSLGVQAWGNYQLGTEEIWKQYYTALVNIRELEKRFGEMTPSPELSNMKALVKIVTAYKTFRMTDMFGDIPFFDAGRGFQDLIYLHPKYDSQRSIYLFLLDELKWANDSINLNAIQDPYKTFGGFDKLFNGDLLMWKKFANSIRLKQALQMSDVEPQLAGEVISEILDNSLPLINGYNFIDYVGENVLIKPANVGMSNDAYSWSFREHKNLRMGTNIWRQFSENDLTDGSGIFDVRAFYFFETNYSNEWKAFPQNPESGTAPDGGTPYETHRDNAFSEKGENCKYSPFNYFLVRDPDNVPEILMSGAEVHFIKAEIYMRGIGVAADEAQAEIEYMQGLETSVRFWTDIVENSTLPNNLNAYFFDLINVPSYLDYTYLLNKVAFWNFTAFDDKLKMIISQRWINYFRQPLDAWSLCRRTMNTPREGDPLTYFRLPYPPSEQEYNEVNYMNAIAVNGNDSGAKLWWMY